MTEVTTNKAPNPQLVMSLFLFILQFIKFTFYSVIIMQNCLLWLVIVTFTKPFFVPSCQTLRNFSISDKTLHHENLSSLRKSSSLLAQEVSSASSLQQHGRVSGFLSGPRVDVQSPVELQLIQRLSFLSEQTHID